jgi:hypothetical protein
METILNEILANELYMIIAAVLIIAVVISAIKKLTKFLLYCFVALAAFFVYLYYTGSTVADTIQQGKKVIEKTEQAVDEKKKEVEDAKKKVKEELKK